MPHYFISGVFPQASQAQTLIFSQSALATDFFSISSSFYIGSFTGSGSWLLVKFEKIFSSQLTAKKMQKKTPAPVFLLELLRLLFFSSDFGLAPSPKVQKHVALAPQPYCFKKPFTYQFTFNLSKIRGEISIIKIFQPYLYRRKSYYIDFKHKSPT